MINHTDEQKLLIYKFEHNEILNNEEIVELFELDQNYFEIEGFHIVKNYEELIKKYNEIIAGDNKMDKFDNLIDKAEDKIEEIKDKIEEGKTPKIKIKANKFLLIMIIVLLLVIVIGGAVYNAKIKKLENRDPDIVSIEPSDNAKVDQVALLRAMSPAAELSTYKYSYANWDVYEDAKRISWLKNIKVPFTTDKVVFAYSGEIKVGIKNMKDIELSVDDENKIIKVLVPELEIISNDFKKLETYDVKNSIFNEMSLNDSEEFKQALKENESALLIEEKEFWDNAKEKTQELLSSLLTATGQINDYKIEFLWIAKQGS